jgi:hypothetical protein
LTVERAQFARSANSHRTAQDVFMRKPILLSLPAVLVVAASCSSSGGTGAAPAAPAPAPAAAAPAPAGRGAAVAAEPAQAGRGGRGAGGGAAGAPGGGRGGPQLTLEQRQARQDSIAAARAETVKQVLASIAGKESQPAGEVFKNVQLMKTMTATQLLTAMDQGIGRGLGRGCNDCHVTNDWASDTLPRKKTARTMMGIVNDINTALLPRMGPGRGGAPRSISCITCHRGGQAGRNVTIP